MQNGVRVMRGDQGLRKPAFDKPDDLSGRNSERVPASTNEVTRGSHVTPVAPVADPTDPVACSGPLTLPPTWFPNEELEPASVATDPFGPTDGSELSSRTLGSLGEIIPPRPRDTVPSPPPCMEEYELSELPNSEDRPKTS